MSSFEDSYVDVDEEQISSDNLHSNKQEHNSSNWEDYQDRTDNAKDDNSTKTLSKTIFPSVLKHCMHKQQEHIQQWNNVSYTSEIENKKNAFIQVMEQMKAYSGLPLFKKDNFVYGEGDLHSRVLYILQSPSVNEAKSCQAFSDDYCKFLKELNNRIIGEDRSFYMYIFPYSIHNNREISEEEKEIFLPYARRRVDILKPKIIVCVGEKPFTYLLHGFNYTKPGTKTSIKLDSFKIDSLNAKQPRIIKTQTHSMILKYCSHPYPAYKQVSALERYENLTTEQEDQWQIRHDNLYANCSLYKDLYDRLQNIGSNVNMIALKNGAFTIDEHTGNRQYDTIALMKKKQHDDHQKKLLQNNLIKKSTERISLEEPVHTEESMKLNRETFDLPKEVITQEKQKFYKNIENKKKRINDNEKKKRNKIKDLQSQHKGKIQTLLMSMVPKETTTTSSSESITNAPSNALKRKSANEESHKNKSSTQRKKNKKNYKGSSLEHIELMSEESFKSFLTRTL